VPRSTFPRDRFDDVPDDRARVGAHRAENPHMRGWVVFLWAAVATVVLVAVGIFATLVASGRVTLFPTAEPTPTPIVTAEAVTDTTYAVIVLNATPVEGLATTVKDQIVAAGWSVDAVTAGQAGSQDFPTTTVFYAFPEDEGPARGLAEVIGGADVAQSDVYQQADDAATPEDESQAKQLAVVIGLDRVSTPAPSASG
jgi:hypothetical protein